MPPYGKPSRVYHRAWTTLTGCPHIHELLGLWILPDLVDNPTGLPTGPWTTLRVAHKIHSSTTNFLVVFSL